MAVTAPKKAIQPRLIPHQGEMLEIIEVTREYLDEHQTGTRTWQSLLEACMTDDRCQYRYVPWNDLSCAHGWAFRSDDPRAAIQNKAWFRKGPGDLALLYQQAWRVIQPGERTEW